MRRYTMVLMALLGACKDAPSAVDGGTPTDAGVQVDTVCHPSTKRYKTACLPVLDDCTGDRVPIPGGGCKRVGVAECDGGIKGPPDWKCKRIGAEECDGGIGGPPDWKCKRVGATPATCPAGWTRVAKGWCEPILPQGTCSAATMEVIGKTTCQPIGSCGSGTYGSIKTTGDTLFVDAAYVGESDGSASKPFTTIGAALSQAPAGAQIAVAKGVYSEQLVIDRSVTLEGRCAQMVKLQGTDKQPVIAITAEAVTVRGVTVTGPDRGIYLEAGRATVESSAVHGCKREGIVARNGASLVIRHTLVAGNASYGVDIQDARATLERVTLRDTSSSPLVGDAGEGLHANTVSGKTTVAMKDCVVAGNRDTGIFFGGTTATLERTVVKDTQGRLLDGQNGDGVVIALNLVSPRKFGNLPSDVTLKDCLVANNRSDGVLAYFSKATLVRTVIRDTQPQASDKRAGQGAAGWGATLSLKDCTVSGNRGMGVYFYGGHGVLERTVVRDTLVQASDQLYGEGIRVTSISGTPQVHTSLAVTDCLVAGNQGHAALLLYSKVTIDRSILRDSKAPDKSTSTNGIRAVGYKGAPSMTLELRDSRISAGTGVGVSGWGAKLLVERTVVTDTRSVDGTEGRGIVAAMNQDSPSSLVVRDSLVSKSYWSGIHTAGSSPAQVERTVVRDTALGGAMQLSHTSTVKDCLVYNSKGMGIQVTYSTEKKVATATVERTVVRRTTGAKTTDPAYQFGLGIFSEGRSIFVRDSVVDRATTAGIVLFDSKALVERSVVRDTRTLKDPLGVDRGVGIYAGYYVGDTSSGTTQSELTLRDSLLSDNSGAGLVLWSAKATVERTVVQDTRKTGSGYGDGISAATKKGKSEVSLALSDSLVQASARAGLLFSGGGGAVKRSVFRGAIFSIVVEEGAQPEIGPGNLFEGNTDNRISYGPGLKPCPPLTLPPAP